MNRKSTKLLMRFAGGLICAASISAPVWLVGTHDGFRVSSPPERKAVASTRAEADSQPPTLPAPAELETIWQRRVHAAPPAPPTPVSQSAVAEAPKPPPPQPLRVSLIATAINPNNAAGSRAVLLNEDNQMVVLGVDGETGDARVVRIEATRVVLNHRGSEVSLSLPDSRADRARRTSARRDEP